MDIVKNVKTKALFKVILRTILIIGIYGLCTYGITQNLPNNNIKNLLDENVSLESDIIIVMFFCIIIIILFNDLREGFKNIDKKEVEK